MITPLLPVLALALSLADNDTVYVRARNTKLLAAPSATAQSQRTLKAGEPLRWHGAGPDGFHKVTVPGGPDGFVYFANLTAARPREENTVASGKAVDTASFTSSGAATKAASEKPFFTWLADSEKALSEGDSALAKARKDLAQLDEIAAAVDDAAVEAHLRKAGLAVEPSP